MLAKRQMQPQLETLGQIQWQKFTDNFLTLYAANRWKYVWCYSERMNWWLPPEKAGKNGGLPPGVEEAVIAARRKCDAGKPLGYDIADMIGAAREKRHAAEAKAAKPDRKP